MRYFYKKVALHTTILSCNVLTPLQISYGTETQAISAEADDKTMAVLNEMLATLQQPVKADEQLPHTAPITTSENNAMSTNVSVKSAVDPIVLPQDAENPNSERQALSIPNVSPQQVAGNVLAQEPTSQQIFAEGNEIESLGKEKIDEKIGIDTINLPDPQGNWLYKSIWYERAQERYENIRGLVDKVWDFRTTFLEKRTDLDRAVLDPFYISVGLRIGELQEVLADLINRFNAERDKDGTLDVQERSLLKELKGEQEVITRLRDQVNVITELDHRIDEALNKLMDQLNKVRAYERDAWNNFKKISQLLSDTKARELYYAMDIQMRNIKDIQKYLQNDFSPYFKTTVDRITKEIASVQQSVEKLKEQGVDFKTQADILFQTIVNPVTKDVNIEKNEHAPVVEDREESNTKLTFLERVLKMFNNLLDLIIYPTKLLFKKIFKTS
ncbi:hypothetical protein EKK58_01665 [Candidatus Dependentiae bacterium]|nr:MAG: hypothetical protein EKK58_01665 [Candidatus Dependentiae bacterium]